MSTSHLAALCRKHESLERKIHEEEVHVARNDGVIRHLKEEKLHLKEEIERLRRDDE